jgi:hypothetical protein
MGRKRARPSPTEEEEYVCTCEEYCHGSKGVSRRTFERHAKYRRKARSVSLSGSYESDGSDDSNSDISCSSESSEEESGRADGHASPRSQKRPKLEDDFAPDLSQTFDDVLETDFTSAVWSQIFSAGSTS